jgi:hypothetical protein
MQDALQDKFLGDVNGSQEYGRGILSTAWQRAAARDALKIGMRRRSSCGWRVGSVGGLVWASGHFVCLDELQARVEELAARPRNSQQAAASGHFVCLADDLKL